MKLNGHGIFHKFSALCICIAVHLEYKAGGEKIQISQTLMSKKLRKTKKLALELLDPNHLNIFKFNLFTILNQT